ncbi:MAG: 50S ribosomal protein L23 [Patescibacteria group bacterium]|nr:50S ribosomal protein L23 [Patescibacteria group bacterium]
MPLFGFRTHKKYDKDFSQEKAVGASGKTTKTRSKPVKKSVVTKTETKTPVVAVEVASSMTASVVIRPHITEKSGILSQNGSYTFEVARSANKDTIAKAINAIYKVKPMRVSIINVPAKRVFVRGKAGRVSGMRKAVVTLKKGDKIDFV